VRRWRLAWSAAAPATAATELCAAAGIRNDLVVIVVSLIVALGEQIFPVSNDVGTVAVDFQPGQRLGQ